MSCQFRSLHHGPGGGLVESKWGRVMDAEALVLLPRVMCFGGFLQAASSRSAEMERGKRIKRIEESLHPLPA